jgi:hypothetical protein
MIIAETTRRGERMKSNVFVMTWNSFVARLVTVRSTELIWKNPMQLYQNTRRFLLRYL